MPRKFKSERGQKSLQNVSSLRSKIDMRWDDGSRDGVM